MKKNVALTVCLAICFILTNQLLATDIWTLDFETSGGYTTSVTEFVSSTTDYFSRTDGSNIGASFSNILGDYYFAAQDIDANGDDAPLTITIDDINISGYTDLNFSIYLAEDDASDSNEDWDAGDYLHIDCDIDNTGTFSNLIWIEGLGGNNTAPYIDTNFDGTGDGSEITSTFTQFSSSITGTGNTIDLRIVFDDLQYGDEDIAIDNLVISGTPTGGVADPSGFSATAASASQINLSWTQNGSSDDVMVAWNSSDTFGEPSGSYSVGNPISGGGTVIYNGSGASYNHLSLDANTTYYYKAWSVDGSTNYSSGVTANATTYKDEPSNHVTGFSAAKDGTYGYSRIDLSWTENDGSVAPDGYLIKASTSDNISDPVDGTAVDDNTTIGSNSGTINISHGTTSYEWTGLSAEQTYYFKIYPYTNSGSAINYKTDGTVPSGNATTDAMPDIPELMISEVADPSDNYNARFIELYNASASSINFSSTTFYLSRQSNGGTWGNVQLTGTLAEGDIYIIAYSATAFNSAFGFDPDLESGIVNGNGDDGYFIYFGGDNSSGTLIDAYGVINVDGTGEAWEYTDSRAVRKAGTTEPNTTWTASEWTISSATAAECGPTDTSLPVELQDFNATPGSGKVKLSWITESETENLGFIIERRQEAGEWKQLASYVTDEALQGQGSTSERHEYSYTDAEVVPGTSYAYHLGDVDYSGAVTWHSTAEVTVPENSTALPMEFGLHKAYPNPFNPSATLSYSLTDNGQTTLTVYNMRGQLVETLVNAYQQGGFYNIRWQPRDLSAGVYIVRLESGSKTNLQKVVFVK